MVKKDQSSDNPLVASIDVHEWSIKSLDEINEFLNRIGQPSHSMEANAVHQLGQVKMALVHLKSITRAQTPSVEAESEPALQS